MERPLGLYGCIIALTFTFARALGAGGGAEHPKLWHHLGKSETEVLVKMPVTCNQVFVWIDKLDAANPGQGENLLYLFEFLGEKAQAGNKMASEKLWLLSNSDAACAEKANDVLADLFRVAPLTAIRGGKTISDRDYRNTLEYISNSHGITVLEAAVKKARSREPNECKRLENELVHQKKTKVSKKAIP